jgi:hypothetical protein
MHYHGDREIPDDYEVEPPPIYLWTRRLGLAMANRDNDMLQFTADEIGDCLPCWQQVAYNLADRWVSALRDGDDDPDAAATYIASTLAKALHDD